MAFARYDYQAAAALRQPGDNAARATPPTATGAAPARVLFDTPRSCLGEDDYRQAAATPPEDLRPDGTRRTSPKHWSDPRGEPYGAPISAPRGMPYG